MIQFIRKMMKKVKSTEKGQGMVEYALIIAFVAAIAIFALNGGLGQAVKGAFDNASSMVGSASSSINQNATNIGGSTGSQQQQGTT